MEEIFEFIIIRILAKYAMPFTIICKVKKL